MSPWALPLVPGAGGLLVWAFFARRPARGALGACATLVALLTAGLAFWSGRVGAESSFAWAPQLVLRAEATPLVGAMSVLVPLIAAPVLVWAVAHETRRGLGRLVGLLLLFVGAMELLVVAADLLTLVIGWELVGALSFALIAHRLGDGEAAAGAVYAYDATRIGGLGLLVAAGAAFAATGSFAFAELSGLSGSARGLFAGGVLVAAASKSAQLPFSPWLSRAMRGPTSVSALLHASTMVAAGGWLLLRLQAELQPVTWLGPAAIALGLATAITAGVVALLETHAKRVLAASTAAHFGLVFAAAGAGAAGAAFAHLVAHAAFKALLFLVAGTAMHAAGTGELPEMRLGRRLPLSLGAGAVGALALAGIPPLGGAWTKEKIIAGLGELDPLLAGLGVLAGALSAAYAARFHLLAFGAPPEEDERVLPRARLAERASLVVLAAASLGLGVLWWPFAQRWAASELGLSWPSGQAWELALALVAALAAAHGARVAVRARATPLGARVPSWLGLDAALRALVIDPTLRLARVASRFDERPLEASVRGVGGLARRSAKTLERLAEAPVRRLVGAVASGATSTAELARRVDEEGVRGAVNGVARGTLGAGDDARRLQDGAVPTYYGLLVVGGLALLGLLFVGI